MAEIRPIRPWRYNTALGKDIETLTSPLFDVVSEKQRQTLYQNPYNSIHLSVPLGDVPAETAEKTLEKWKLEGILMQDPLPGIYVYYQYFTLHGSAREYVRKGFICNIKAYDWSDNVILRHENTIPKSVNDRIDILANTQLNASPTHGLYTDPDFLLEEYMDESMAHPLYESEDYQGVRDVLSVIHDAQVIKLFLKTLADKEVILADGHHRYEGSLAYRKAQLAQNPDATGMEGFNFHMMYLTNSEADDLRILPTHRLIHELPEFDEESILSEISRYFTIKPVENVGDIQEIILGKQWAFGIIFNENAYKIRLKPEVFESMRWKFPLVVKQLDLTVMHYFIIEKIFNIPADMQRSSEHISFERSFTNCLQQIHTGNAQCGLITSDITMEEVKKVCHSGYTLPQKSTYFYPKVICGFLFGTIKEDEFQTPVDTCF